MAAPPTQAGPHAEMNVTSMLDVLLVLLVIFMLVATRTRRRIASGLPRAARATRR
jgi:biopolymer transport protein ExbD